MAELGKKRRALRREEREASATAVEASRRLLACPDEAIEQLKRAEIIGYQVVPAGTNYTFFVLMEPSEGDRFLGVYKPMQGENPLWDYPDGTLYKREHAAYVASIDLGWPNIPPTVIRDGPYGIGMAQLFVAPGSGQDFSAFRRKRSAELMEIALFDLLVNNGDRKAGHCILGADGKLWAIDHGLTFNRATRLRTVLWDYCGEPIPERLVADLVAIRDDPRRQERIRKKLAADLEGADADAFFVRLEKVLRSGRYPQLDPDRNLPWPLV